MRLRRLRWMGALCWVLGCGGVGPPGISLGEGIVLDEQPSEPDAGVMLPDGGTGEEGLLPGMRPVGKGR